ncbi:MAG: asparagine synthase (glutamine-hydrolyzing) [Planctomycetota bacterium]|nr:asparagine synthase (glutamine-hydrolyzing) [Planctomycetota bacterium]
MCGIVGTVGDLGAVGDALGPALALLAVRGPDGGGRASGRLGERPVEFGARRLALVDLVGGAQPVRRPSGALLVFNGEVYNHAALRGALAAQGVPFASSSDGEVLAALLEVEGVAGLARIEGSYAFAFLAPGGPLLLGRDPAGVRPLAYAAHAGGLTFASTLDALVATRRIAAEPDMEALVDVLRDGVVPGVRTALRGVARVAPGQVLAFDAELRCTTHTVPQAERAGSREAPEQPDVLQALRAAVHDRLAVDRPAALLLSGGIDSALIGAVARELGALPAFTLGYPGQGEVDETDRARRTAKRLGLPHEVIPCPLDPTSWVLGAARAFDEPFADASAVPAWGLARAVGCHARVVLSGTGGDEVFGGYRRYWLLGSGPWLRHVPRFVRDGVTKVIQKRMPQGARMLQAAGDPEGLYRGLLRLQPLTEVRGVLGPLLEHVADPLPRPGPTTPWEAMADDLTRYLPDDLLVKEDRAFMAHALEGRYPYLDARVRRAARDLELKGGPGRARQKQVLRAYVRDAVDAELARSPKHGFSFPVDALYRGALRGLAEDALLGQRARERGFLSPAGARRLVRDHLHGAREAGQTIHAFVMLELWARRFLDHQAG